MAIRSFLAFELPGDIGKEVKRISTEIRKTDLNAGWVKPENIHLTVVFIGTVDENDIKRIIQAVDKTADKYGPFEISLKGAGLFPNIKRPKVMWLGLDCDIRALGNLRDDLQKRLEPFGVEPEKRPFRPHLTIGRFRRPVKDMSLLKRVLDEYSSSGSGPAGRLEELVLFKSDLKPGGAVYTRIHSFPLGVSTV